jgi:uncharacterized RDD family membrane protein YckC
MDWYYAQDGRQMGPVPEAELPRLVSEGAITNETLVWHSGMGEWQPYGTTIGVPPLPHMPAAAAVSEQPGGPGAQRFCSSCGKPFPASELTFFGDSAVCAWCKPGYIQRLAQAGTAPAGPRTLRYAGFWIRVLAYLIDGMIIGAIRWAVLLPMGFGLWRRPMDPDYAFSWIGTAPLVSLAVGICYFVFFWTQYGATPGKMVLKLKVITPEGGLISAGQAVGRYFSQILSGLILCIGFMMAGWDDEKRALHDRIAGTRVICVE